MGGEQVAFEYCDDILLRLGDVAIARNRMGGLRFQADPAGRSAAGRWRRPGNAEFVGAIEKRGPQNLLQ